jgi:hypothetical protein
MAVRRISVLRALGVLALFAAVQAAGCGQKTAQQQVDEALKSAGQSRKTVFPLAGKVTIDGQAPETKPGRRIVVMLFDRDKLDASPRSVPKTVVNPNGDFAFNMYGDGDGVPPGQYVAAIVEMKFDFKRGYVGKDGLQNLYNDPEKNAKDPQFAINHESPGKRDYAFDLKVAGRDPVTPGPRAVTKLQ